MRKVCEPDEAFYSEEDRDEWLNVANEVTIDLYGFSDGHLAISRDDTIHPDHDGGPCAGSIDIVHIDSLADHLIELADRISEATSAVDPDSDSDMTGYLTAAALYLEQEARKLRSKLDSGH